MNKKELFAYIEREHFYGTMKPGARRRRIIERLIRGEDVASEYPDSEAVTMGDHLVSMHIEFAQRAVAMLKASELRRKEAAQLAARESPVKPPREPKPPKAEKVAQPRPTYKRVEKAPRVRATRAAPLYASERAFATVITARLKGQGFDVLCEVPVPGGRIDIVANRGSEQWVIEAKLSANLRSVHGSLGQLLAYGFYRPDALLFFAAPERPGPDLVQLLERYSVRVLDLPEDEA